MRRKKKWTKTISMRTRRMLPARRIRNAKVISPVPAEAPLAIPLDVPSVPQQARVSTILILFRVFLLINILCTTFRNVRVCRSIKLRRKRKQSDSGQAKTERWLWVGLWCKSSNWTPHILLLTHIFHNRLQYNPSANSDSDAGRGGGGNAGAGAGRKLSARGNRGRPSRKSRRRNSDSEDEEESEISDADSDVSRMQSELLDSLILQ